MCYRLTSRAFPIKSIRGLLALAVMLGLCPMGADAQPVPENSLENAIGDCIGKEGATGDAVGDLTIDLKTGRIVYRCDSDPKGAEKVLKAGDGEKTVGGGARAAKTQAGTLGSNSTLKAGETPRTAASKTEGTSKAASKAVAKGENQKPVEDIPAADHGAAAAYMNTPRGPAPDRPQDCVGAHPYYMTFPVCIMARKMGLLGKRSTDGPTATAQELPPGTAMPPPAAGANAPGTVAPGTGPSGTDPSGTAPPGTATAADTLAPGSLKQTADPLPEDTAQASDQVNASAADDASTGKSGSTKDGEAVKARPMGTVSGSGVVKEGTDWIAMATWAGVGLGGLVVLGGLIVGVLVIVNRIRIKRLGDADDPYLAYFDDPNDLKPVEEEGGGPGLFGDLDGERNPLGAFDEEPLDGFTEEPEHRKKGKAAVDRSRAFSA